MLAHKSSMPVSAGLGASSGAAREYQSNTPSHNRTPLTGSTQNGTFASPTESDFSEAYDGADAVRYAPISSSCNSPAEVHQKHLAQHLARHLDSLSRHSPALSPHYQAHMQQHQSSLGEPETELPGLPELPALPEDESDHDCSSWDERRVGEWLRSINCGQYADVFKGRMRLF